MRISDWSSDVCSSDLEVVAKSWEARERRRLPCFFAVGDERALSVIWRGPIVRIGTPAEATAIFPNALPLIQVDDPGDIIPGEPNTPGARCELASLELAAALPRSGAAAAGVTAPVPPAPPPTTQHRRLGEEGV